MEEFNQLNTKDIERLIDTWNKRIVVYQIAIVIFAAFFVSVCVYLYRVDKYAKLVNTYIDKVDEYTTQLNDFEEYAIEELLNVEYKRF